MIQTVRLNFKADKLYKKGKFECPDCLTLVPPIHHPDSQELLLTCVANRDLREGRDLSNLKEEAEYYLRVISRRTQKYGK